jgi:hypothetical protein
MASGRPFEELEVADEDGLTSVALPRVAERSTIPAPPPSPSAPAAGGRTVVGRAPPRDESRMSYVDRLQIATDAQLGNALPPITLAIGVAFVGEEFRLVDAQAAVALTPRFHQFGTLRGYCIWKAGANQCWQVNPKRPGEITYWNADGKAARPPQDWELFDFDRVGPGDDRIKIKTIYNSYIQLKGGRFVTGANASVAAIFTIVEHAAPIAAR